MKRFLLSFGMILALCLFLLGCSKAPSKENPNPPVSVPQGQKSTESPAEIDSQTDNVQAEIDNLLTELEKDADSVNLDKENIK